MNIIDVNNIMTNFRKNLEAYVANKGKPEGLTLSDAFIEKYINAYLDEKVIPFTCDDVKISFTARDVAMHAIPEFKQLGYKERASISMKIGRKLVKEYKFYLSFKMKYITKKNVNYYTLEEIKR